MAHIFIRALASGIALGLTASPACASIVHYAVGGTVYTGEDVFVGKPFTITFAFDTAVPPTVAGFAPDGSYSATYGSTFEPSAFFTQSPTATSGDDTFHTGDAALTIVSSFYYGQYRTDYTFLGEPIYTDGTQNLVLFEIEEDNQPGVTEGLPTMLSLDANTSVLQAAFTTIGPADGSMIGDDGVPITTGLQQYTNEGRVTSLNVYTDPVAEPGTWAMLLAGFGLVGSAARHRSRRTAVSLERGKDDPAVSEIHPGCRPPAWEPVRRSG